MIEKCLGRNEMIAINIGDNIFLCDMKPEIYTAAKKFTQDSEPAAAIKERG